jgi:hypothetical protein
MVNLKDMVGRKYGKLFVICYVGTDEWLCACTCGKQKVIKGSNLRAGRTKSCGCLHREKLLFDLTGEKFGNLTVIGFADSSAGFQYKNAHWKCRCDCGKEVVFSSASLRKGSHESCGCSKKAVQFAVTDLSGLRFGKLVVIAYVGTKSRHSTWLCKCDCGKEVSFNEQSLKNGKVKSCGCLWKKSEKEKRLTRQLQDARRRDRKHGTMSDITLEDINLLESIQSSRCVSCGCEIMYSCYVKNVIVQNTTG